MYFDCEAVFVCVKANGGKSQSTEQAFGIVALRLSSRTKT